MSVIYKKGSLFDAPKGSILLHAVNAQGVWGGGIAAQFKERFPKSFQEYRGFCLSHQKPADAVGRCFVTSEDIACLVTSEGYGGQVDGPGKILENTINALLTWAHEGGIRENVHSNKFNSGLFNVPWEYTEAAIKAAYTGGWVPWTVWDPDL